jgi:subtilisin family serine protease
LRAPAWISVLAVVAGCGDAPSAAPPDTAPPSVEVIPALKMVEPRREDFRMNPRLGIATSSRHLLVSLRKSYSPEALAHVVQLSAGALVGTVPSARILQFEYPQGTSFEALEETLAVLRAHAAVAAVAYDTQLFVNIVPPSNASPPGPESWGVPGDPNWGLEQIRAPLAWNLARRAESNPEVKVTVIDAGFFGHDDLVIDQPWLAPGHTHGTGVAGIIGARWNGKHVDGVAPRAVLRGLAFAPAGGTAEAWATSFGATIKGIVEGLPGDDRPRIVNMSLGYNWYQICRAMPNGRCDPRLIGPLLPDNGCNSGNVNAVIAAQGQIFGDVVEALNAPAQAPILFVAAAGNDSGPMNATGVDWCLNRCVCTAGAAACGAPAGTMCNGGAWAQIGMGNFPAHLSSPMNWAAINHVGARPHMIVAEASAQAGAWAVARAGFSNVNGGGVFAPGQAIGLLTKDTSTAIQNGTSFASPFVAGAAAYLVSVQPDLGNAELKQLLTHATYTDPIMAMGTNTAVHLNLFKAVLGIDDLRPGKKIRRWLADIDDGTDDSFQRVEYNDLNVMIGGGVNADRQRDPGNLGPADVDFNDFRRLRDNDIMYGGLLKPIAMTPDADTNKKRDLNFDGTGLAATPVGEPWPRAAFSSNHLLGSWGTAGTELPLLQEVYQPSGIQKWPAAALVDLRHSVDLIVRAQEAIKALGADGVILRIVQDDMDTLPPALAAHELQLKGPMGLYGQGFYLAANGPKNVWFTTPIFTDMRVRWAPVKNGQVPQPGDFFTHHLTAMKVPDDAGRDRVVKLRECGKPIDAKIEEVLSQYVVNDCTFEPFLNQCVSCNGCLGTTIPLTAVNSTDPEGKPLTFSWECQGPCSIGGKGHTVNLNMTFDVLANCYQTTFQDINVTVKVNDGCEEVVANRKISFVCKFPK